MLARGSLLVLRRGVVGQRGGGSGVVSLGNLDLTNLDSLTQTKTHDVHIQQQSPLFCNNNNSIISPRYFSSTSSGTEKKSMLRLHAVSLYQADYDDGEGDTGNPQFDHGEGDTDSPDTYLDPRDRRKAEEEEERTWWLYDGTQESRDALETMRAKEAQKKRWIQNSRPPVRISEIDERGRAYGRGTRKTAKARVWVQPGEGEIVVNRKDFVTYFPRETDRDHILGPFVASQTCGKFDVVAMVQGGGLTGQAGAIRLGLARALEKYNPDYRPPMKRHGFMTRDPRMVERKKVGRVKARKSPQWVRR